MGTVYICCMDYGLAKARTATPEADNAPRPRGGCRRRSPRSRQVSPSEDWGHTGAAAATSRARPQRARPTWPGRPAQTRRCSRSQSPTASSPTRLHSAANQCSFLKLQSGIPHSSPFPTAARAVAATHLQRLAAGLDAGLQRSRQPGLLALDRLQPGWISAMLLKTVTPPGMRAATCSSCRIVPTACARWPPR